MNEFKVRYSSKPGYVQAQVDEGRDEQQAVVRAILADMAFGSRPVEITPRAAPKFPRGVWRAE